MVHSLNIHGTFFERWCTRTIEGGLGWNIRSTGYPVQHDGKESCLDILAECAFGNQEVVSFVIECKKNNPELVNWVFFSKFQRRREDYQFVTLVSAAYPPREQPDPHDRKWSCTRLLAPSVRLTGTALADDAREVRSDYLTYTGGNKTKTSNAAINDAAHQVAIATAARSSEEHNFAVTLAAPESGVRVPMWLQKTFVPVIVTTARPSARARNYPSLLTKSDPPRRDRPVPFCVRQTVGRARKTNWFGKNE
jgi:hypothetical protein